MCHYFIWGDVLWIIYSLIYLILCLYQLFHGLTYKLQIVVFLYIAIMFASLVSYEITQGFSKITRSFFTIYTISLGLTCVWEAIVLFLAIKDKIEKNERQ